MARTNSFVDYSETEKPGLYQFKDSSGGSRLLWGTAAEQIKTGIDKGRASVSSALGRGDMSADEWNAMATPPAPAKDERTAAFDQASPEELLAAVEGKRAPPPRSVADAGSAHAAPAERTLWDVKGQTPAPPAGAIESPVPELTPEQEMKFRTRAPEQARAMRDKEAAASPAGADFELVFVDPKTGKQTYHRKGSSGAGAGDVMVIEPARAGSAGRPGGWRDMSMQVQGGHAVNEDLLGQMQMSSGVREVAIEENLASQEEENRLVQEEITRQADLQAKLVDEERRRQEDVQRFTDNAKSELEKYTAQINNAQINPDRIYSGEGGKAREVRHRIASVFGAFGSTLAKSPNFVAERLARMKEDDIAAQEKDLLKLQGQQDTALKYFRDLTGDLDTAKNAVRALHTQQNILALKKIEALAKTPRDRTAAKVAITNEQETLAKEIDAYLRSAAGVRSVSSQNLMPVAGSPGRAAVTRAPTSEERKDVVSNAKEGKTGSEVEKTLAGQWGDTQAMTALVEKYPDDYVPPTRETMALPGRVAAAGTDFALGQGTFDRNFRSPQERQAMQDAAVIDYHLGAQQAILGGQGALAEGERPLVQAGISPGATMGEKRRALQILGSRVEQKARAQGVTVRQLMDQFRKPAGEQ